MNHTLHLIKPRLWTARNAFARRRGKNNFVRLILFGSLGIIFWIGIFIIFYRVLLYFQSVQEFGDILAMKLLSMIAMIFFMLLLFSNTINFITHLYLSQDLPLLHSLPLSAKDIFISRWLISAFDSSWMIFTFSIPFFLSYGIVYKAGWEFYASFLTVMLLMSLMTSSISGTIVLIGARILPAGRIRTALLIFGVFMVIVFVLLLRLTRPEQLVNPDTFITVVTYLNSMQMPSSPLLPTTWITDAIKAGLNHQNNVLALNLTLAASFALMLMFFNNFIAEKYYFSGFSKSQTTPRRLFYPKKNNKFFWESVFNFLPRDAKAFIIKEIKTFFRDSSQWPQLFLMGALVVIYLYNFSVLPLDKSPINAFYLQNLFSFLNIALAASVLAAIAARFVFPAVSMEGQAFWIIQAAPVSLRNFLWIKFFLYYFPSLVLAEILIVISNLFLQVSTFMMVLSVLTIFALVPAIVGMAVGLGAIYADFKSENATQVVTGFGGLLFMILSFSLIAAVVILEAGPLYYITLAQIRGRGMASFHFWGLTISLCLVLFLCATAMLYSMHIGRKSLLRRQFL
jgi:ABC-2 type transport system permease protein